MTARRGKPLDVRVLYSLAGVATTIAVRERSAGCWLMLDCGDGALRDLLRAKLDPLRLRGILLSHGHFDHLGGLHSLGGFLRMIGRAEALPVFFPAGCREAVSFITRFRELYPDCPFAFEERPLSGDDEAELDGWRITARAVEHSGSTAAGVGPPIPALGYRVERDGRTVAFSGDSGPCANLAELCRGADLALVEATWRRSEPPGARRVHLTRAEARGYGRLACRYRLIHFDL